MKGKHLTRQLLTHGASSQVQSHIPPDQRLKHPYFFSRFGWKAIVEIKVMHNQPLPAQNNQSQSLLWSAIAAAMVMAIGMGFGRFAYTGVYPAMVHEGIVSLHDGTLAASANYAGYLLGALLAARLSSGHSRRWVIVSILASVVGLIALAYIAQPWLIISIRGVAGLFSALSMIAVSAAQGAS
ncbi:YbfB/YjiJ family MFS transporter [Pseudomonas amygdali]|uniref:YbfB/YjiJ family MFS transporter n=1 Tax=Pseudomonas amygdali TaxID=47877 RepID=UPI000F3D5130|nr:YbfB/YjiJ family MFS transporter [Pseudomonas amygdali]RMU36333.1 putative sugar transport protein [Pseudomonas amygdali pv. morsprunorum]